jgi:hypothetical protein
MAPRKKSRTSLLVLTGVLVVLLAAVVAGWYLWGVGLAISTSPGGAQVYLDDREVGRTAEGSGTLLLAHVRRGRHLLQVKREGHEDWVEPLDLKLTQFSGSIQVALRPSLLSLTLVTTPPAANVLVNEKPVGVTDPTEGKLVIRERSGSQLSLRVQKEGYAEWAQNVTLDSSKSLRVELTGAPGAGQSSSAPAPGPGPSPSVSQQARGQAAQLVATAQTQFAQRDYQNALESCNQALKLDPQNQAAAKLRAQIRQTMRVLGIQP